MSLHRPIAALRPFVQLFWASERSSTHMPRERVLPGGGMHVAIRLDGTPLHLYRDDGDTVGESIGCAVVAGAHTRFYSKRTPAADSVGMLLRPGAARALLGCAAHDLAERHVALDAVWSPGEVARLHERLAGTDDARHRIALFQLALLARLRPMKAMHPAIAHSLAPLERGARIADVVNASGCSHRHFIARFREATGLAPKEYARVRRFRRVLRSLVRDGELDDTALDAGYSDQAHLQREFRAMAGMTPCQYRRAGARGELHVPMVNFVQDRPRDSL